MEQIKNKSFGGERPLFGAHDVRRARHRRRRAHEGKAELASALSAFTKVKR